MDGVWAADPARWVKFSKSRRLLRFGPTEVLLPVPIPFPFPEGYTVAVNIYVDRRRGVAKVAPTMFAFGKVYIS